MLGFIVGLTILPAVPEDTYPLERQGTNGHLVSLSFLPLGLVNGPRPEGKAHRLVGPFDEGLSRDLCRDSWVTDDPTATVIKDVI